MGGGDRGLRSGTHPVDLAIAPLIIRSAIPQTIAPWKILPPALAPRCRSWGLGSEGLGDRVAGMGTDGGGMVGEDDGLMVNRCGCGRDTP